MIEDKLSLRYHDCLIGLDIYENTSSIRLSRIIVKPECRGMGIGSKIITELTDYADNNKQIVVLTPSSDFGGNKNRLVQFYKRFGFKFNKGQYKNFQFSDLMIRYPKMNETRLLIKSLLREALDKTITCTKCGWHWKESESSKKDLYICHKCGHDNTPKKESLNERLLTREDVDIRDVADFVNFAKEYLGIDDDIKVFLAFKRIPELKTTAYYNLDGHLCVYAKNRAIIDVIRSIAHELQHHRQNLDGRLTNPKIDGADGSEIENEANAVAGKIIRIYGKLHPEIYE